jgi:hypothetical protein
MTDTTLNTKPIFSGNPNVDWGITVNTANTTTDLTAGTIYLVWTAGASGGRLEKIKIRPLGTNVATVMRIWINNGTATGTAANNTLYHEITMAATTVSQVAALADTDYPIAISLDPGFRVYVTVGTTVAAGFDVTGVGGSY